FGLVDVDYGGSTGYGRAYRERLNGQWGVVDLQDCVNAARYLVEQDEADGDRLVITGGSAGGYTTICALTFSDVFAAGTTYFGVADLEQFTGGGGPQIEPKKTHTPPRPHTGQGSKVPGAEPPPLNHHPTHPRPRLPAP